MNTGYLSYHTTVPALPAPGRTQKPKRKTLTLFLQSFISDNTFLKIRGWVITPPFKTWKIWKLDCVCVLLDSEQYKVGLSNPDISKETESLAPSVHALAQCYSELYGGHTCQKNRSISEINTVVNLPYFFNKSMHSNVMTITLKSYIKQTECKKKNQNHKSLLGEKTCLESLLQPTLPILLHKTMWDFKTTTEGRKETLQTNYFKIFCTAQQGNYSFTSINSSIPHPF